jgi:hypothetical protein
MKQKNHNRHISINKGITKINNRNISRNKRKRENKKLKKYVTDAISINDIIQFQKKIKILKQQHKRFIKLIRSVQNLSNDEEINNHLDEIFDLLAWDKLMPLYDSDNILIHPPRMNKIKKSNKYSQILLDYLCTKNCKLLDTIIMLQYEYNNLYSNGNIKNKMIELNDNVLSLPDDQFNKFIKFTNDLSTTDMLFEFHIQRNKDCECIVLKDDPPYKAIKFCNCAGGKCISLGAFILMLKSYNKIKCPYCRFALFSNANNYPI